MREYLQIKICNLADEARLIRRHERKHLDRMRHWSSKGETKKSGLCIYRYNNLREHRVVIVRDAARAALLAYGYIRGRRYRQMEATCRTVPNWKEVERLARKYGSSFDEEDFRKWRSQEPLDLAA